MTSLLSRASPEAYFSALFSVFLRDILPILLHPADLVMDPTCESQVTYAFSTLRLTFTDCTPSTLESAFSTLLTQPAQCMPVIWSTVFSSGFGSISSYPASFTTVAKLFDPVFSSS